MDKIDPKNHLTDFTPFTEAVIASDAWYSQETVQMNNPDPSIVAWQLAQGWTISGYRDSDKFYVFTRKQLDSQKTLDDLISSYITAYNEGRQINDQRYDDIINLFSDLLSKTEDTMIGLESDEDDFEDAMDVLIATVETDFNTHNTDVSNDLDDWGTSETTRINAAFAAKLATLRSEMITGGYYNTTTWTSASAGNAREKQEALTDNSDKITRTKLELKNRLYVFKTDMRNKIIAMRDGLIRILQGMAIDRENNRGRIVDALSAFAERRTDSYPDLSQLGNIASNIGIDHPSAIES